MAALPRLDQPLDDGRVGVRDVAERDIPEVLLAYEDDPLLHVRLMQERPPTGAQLGRLAESEAANRASGTRATLTIFESGSDLCVGQVSVHELDFEHRRGQLSVWVAPRARGRGLATGALRLAAGWLLGPCGLARVQILAEPDHAALLRAAARAGFVHEGVLHGYLRQGTGRIDMACLSLTSADMESR